ncbi:MAG: phosphodiesterase [Burkholderiales bacterium]|nr:phosphodiesterase [Burkholderiales bacterium]
MLIAQISDLHIMPPGELAYGRFDTAASLARCVSHIMQLDPLPDTVLATGDLVNGGSAAEYRRLRDLLAPLVMPVHVIPGNHDERGLLCAGFGDHFYLPRPGQAVHYVVEYHEVRLVALDTVVPGEDGGALGSDQLDWLEATLAAGPHQPTLVFMHHPPVRTGTHYMDEIRLDQPSSERLARIIGRHPQVERITCGHVHRGMLARWHGTTVSICPSTAFQYGLDLRSEPSVSVTSEPPAYQLHYWNGAELVTHTVVVT